MGYGGILTEIGKALSNAVAPISVCGKELENFYVKIKPNTSVHRGVWFYFCTKNRNEKMRLLSAKPSIRNFFGKK